MRTNFSDLRFTLCCVLFLLISCLGSVQAAEQEDHSPTLYFSVGGTYGSFDEGFTGDKIYFSNSTSDSTYDFYYIGTPKNAFGTTLEGGLAISPNWSLSYHLMTLSTQASHDRISSESKAALNVSLSSVRYGPERNGNGLVARFGYALATLKYETFRIRFNTNGTDPGEYELRGSGYGYGLGYQFFFDKNIAFAVEYIGYNLKFDTIGYQSFYELDPAVNAKISSIGSSVSYYF